jgi:hypothetical protein
VLRRQAAFFKARILNWRTLQQARKLSQRSISTIPVQTDLRVLLTANLNLLLT